MSVAFGTHTNMCICMTKLYLFSNKTAKLYFFVYNYVIYVIGIKHYAYINVLYSVYYLLGYV